MPNNYHSLDPPNSFCSDTSWDNGDYGSFSTGPGLFWSNSQCKWHFGQLGQLNQSVHITICFTHFDLPRTEDKVVIFDGETENNPILWASDKHWDGSSSSFCVNSTKPTSTITFKSDRVVRFPWDNDKEYQSKKSGYVAGYWFVGGFDPVNICSKIRFNFNSKGYTAFPRMQNYNCSALVLHDWLINDPSYKGISLIVTHYDTQLNDQIIVENGTWATENQYGDPVSLPIPNFSTNLLVPNGTFPLQPIFWNYWHYLAQITYQTSQSSGSGGIGVRWWQSRDSLCGDSNCDIHNGETCFHCPSDCGTCAADTCGNGVIDENENCDNCPEDLTYCTCGNNICDSFETCNSCPTDCGYCANCGDGHCDTETENSYSCIIDCIDNTCDLDKNQNAESDCCKPGSFFQGVPGTDSGPGYAGTGFNCSECFPGSFSDHLGASECTPCSTGTFTSQTGQQECQSCPLGSTTVFSSATQESLCIPNKGFWFDQQAAASNPNETIDYYLCTPVEACTDHRFSQCAQSRIPLAKCPNYEACNEHYSGKMCGSCAPDHYRFSKFCIECFGDIESKVFLVGFLLLNLIFFTFLIKFGRTAGRHMGSLFLLIDYWAIVSLLSRLELNWGDMKGVFIAFGSFSLNLDAYQWDCVFPDMLVYQTKTIAYLVSPLIFALCFVLAFGKMYLFNFWVALVGSTWKKLVPQSSLRAIALAKSKDTTGHALRESLRDLTVILSANERERLEKDSARKIKNNSILTQGNSDLSLTNPPSKLYSEQEVDQAVALYFEEPIGIWLNFKIWISNYFVVSYPKRVIHKTFLNMISAYLIFLTMVYIFLVRKTLEIFDCQEQPNGMVFLQANPEIVCYSDEHNLLVNWGIFGLVAYVFGIPIGIICVLKFVKSRLHEKSIKKNVGILFMRYRPEFWYWEAVLCVRRFFCVFVCAFFDSIPLVPTALLMLVLALSLVMQVYWKPYIRKSNNRLSSLFHFIPMGVLCIAVINLARFLAWRSSVTNPKDLQPWSENYYRSDWEVAYILLFGGTVIGLLVTFRELYSKLSQDSDKALSIRLKTSSNYIERYFNDEWKSDIDGVLSQLDIFDVDSFNRFAKKLSQYESSENKNMIKRSLAIGFLHPEYHQLLLEYLTFSNKTVLNNFRYILRSVSFQALKMKDNKLNSLEHVRYARRSVEIDRNQKSVDEFSVLASSSSKKGSFPEQSQIKSPPDHPLSLEVPLTEASLGNGRTLKVFSQTQMMQRLANSKKSLALRQSQLDSPKQFVSDRGGYRNQSAPRKPSHFAIADARNHSKLVDPTNPNPNRNKTQPQHQNQQEIRTENVETPLNIISSTSTPPKTAPPGKNIL